MQYDQCWGWEEESGHQDEQLQVQLHSLHALLLLLWHHIVPQLIWNYLSHLYIMTKEFHAVEYKLLISRVWEIHNINIFLEADLLKIPIPNN